MPLYEFECPACKNREDFLLSMDDISGAKPKCPICTEGMRRIFTPFGIHGFEYPNDVNYYTDTEEAYGEQEQKKEIALTMKKLEQDGRMNELSKDDHKFYEEYCKT